METTNQTVKSLHGLLDQDARRFMSAEIQLMVILPFWVKKASSVKLKIVLQKYLDFVKGHVEKLESFYEEEQLSSISLSNRVMKAFIQETEEHISACADDKVADACLLSCIQGINHFKISSYGTAAAFARALGMENQSFVFHQVEENEKQIDEHLSQLAEFEINIIARAPFALSESVS